MRYREMSFEDTFRAIRMGEIRIAFAFAVECLIMASPFILLGIALFIDR